MAESQIEWAGYYNELMENFPNDFQDMLDDLRWTNDPDALTYIEKSETTAPVLMGVAEKRTVEETTRDIPDLRQAAKNMKTIYDNVVKSRKKINGHLKLGSQAWVVSGDKTASGNPIIYAGPQMYSATPPMVIEGSIRAGGLNVSGMTIPGVPGIIIGRTPHHAWSFQMAPDGHTVDFYLEDLSDVYLHRTEVIKVAGEEDFQLKVYRTSHGPVVHPVGLDLENYIPDPDNPIISWKYSHWGYAFDFTRATLEMARATSMDEFEEGLESVGTSLHSCYADRDGNIAYWMTGRDPERPDDGEWRFPQGFTGPPLEWGAEVIKPRSTDRNTSRGFYGGWNQKTNPDYPSGFNSSSCYGPFHRAHVVLDYLMSQDNLTFEEVRDLALNVATTDAFSIDFAGNPWPNGGGNPWEFVKDDFSSAVHGNSTEDREAALAILDNWDGHFVDGGESEWISGKHRADGWMLMDAWVREVIRLTFEDELGTISWWQWSDYLDPQLFDVLLHGLAGESSSIVNKYNWFQNLADPTRPQIADDIIVEALDNVLDTLGNRPWGKNKRGVTEHVHDIFGTVHTTPFSSRSTYVQCVEFDSTGPVRIESVFPMGQSGNIFSPHFRSMNKLFDAFEYRSFPLFD
jgi:penicillin amidase